MSTASRAFGQGGLSGGTKRYAMVDGGSLFSTLSSWNFLVPIAVALTAPTEGQTAILIGAVVYLITKATEIALNWKKESRQIDKETGIAERNDCLEREKDLRMKIDRQAIELSSCYATNDRLHQQVEQHIREKQSLMDNNSYLIDRNTTLAIQITKNNEMMTRTIVERAASDREDQGKPRPVEIKNNEPIAVREVDGP